MIMLRWLALSFRGSRAAFLPSRSSQTEILPMVYVSRCSAGPSWPLMAIRFTDPQNPSAFELFREPENGNSGSLGRGLSKG